MLIDSRAAYELDELDDDGDLLSLAVPASLLGEAEGRLRDGVARAVPQTPGSRLLVSQLGLLADQGASLPEPAAAAASDLLVALLATTVGAPVDGASGSLAARLRALVARHFHDPCFDAAAAARHAGVSLRSLQACLAREGTSFGALLMAHRLQRAHGWLQGGGSAARVADVAQRCGFRSPEHFARCFRARYGLTPSASRAR
jgi:AraC-like DNA-binding protein